MVTADEISQFLKSRVSSPEQDARIRALYESAHNVYKQRGAKGVTDEIQSHWTKLEARFSKAIAQLRKDTGL